MGTLTSGLPPAPMPQQQEPQQGAPQQQQAQQAPPAPSHAQTVAALRHFNAILSETRGLMKNPDLGRADLKSEIIDRVTRLVADRIVPPGAAVKQLATVPEKPRDQKKWVETLAMQNIQARDFVLSHHATAFAGGGPESAPDPDNHMQDISGMMQSHYGAARG